MTEQQAIRMALENAKRNERHHNVAETRYWFEQYKMIAQQAVDALEQQPADEPVAMNWSVFNTGAEVWDKLSLADAVVELTPARLKRGWSAVCVINKDNPPLYARPQPAAWVGLTDEEIKRIGNLDWDSDYVGLWYDFAKAIEAKLKEKNT